MKQRLTVVAPAFNEEGCIEQFYTVLKEELSRITSYDSTIVFVDDGSRDRTYGILERIATADSAVQVIRLSRNFGHQAALIAGIDHAEGDVIVTMDTDLQHPPSVIPKLIEAYEQGNDIVYTLREEADTTGFFRKRAGSLFYTLINVISDIPIYRNASDFRLISRRVADLIRTRIRERNLFMRGIMNWLGFKQASVSFKANDRFAGTRNYSFSRDMHLATSGLISFSKKPLRAAAFSGALLALFGIVFAAITIMQYFLGTPLAPGWATLIVLLSLFGGAQLFFLGVIGEYIGSIFDEVKGRPHYIVEDTLNQKAVV